MPFWCRLNAFFGCRVCVCVLLRKFSAYLRAKEQDLLLIRSVSLLLRLPYRIHSLIVSFCIRFALSIPFGCLTHIFASPNKRRERKSGRWRWSCVWALLTSNWLEATLLNITIMIKSIYSSDYTHYICLNMCMSLYTGLWTELALPWFQKRKLKWLNFLTLGSISNEFHIKYLGILYFMWSIQFWRVSMLVRPYPCGYDWKDIFHRSDFRLGNILNVIRMEYIDINTNGGNLPIDLNIKFFLFFRKNRISLDLNENGIVLNRKE